MKKTCGHGGCTRPVEFTVKPLYERTDSSPSWLELSSDPTIPTCGWHLAVTCEYVNGGFYDDLLVQFVSPPATPTLHCDICGKVES